jgi:hypothetical protein
LCLPEIEPVFTSSTFADSAYGIGHHAVYQPSGLASIELNRVRVSHSPGPEPKNSLSGASTVVFPSKVIRSRVSFSTASDLASAAGSTTYREVLLPCQLCWSIV